MTSERGHDDDDATSLLDDLAALDLAMLLDIVDRQAADDAPPVPLAVVSSPPAETLDNSSETSVDAIDSTTDANASRATRTQTTRLRQKQEIEHLRQQVGELEEELAKMQQSPERGSAQLLPLERTAQSAWKRIALQQMNAKQRAEAENERLRQKLEGQLKIARGLEKLLRKRTADTEDEDHLFDRKRWRRHEPLQDDLVYEQLRQNLDALYSQFPDTFTQKGLATNKGDIDDIAFLSDSDENMTIELLSARSGPFDLATTNEGLWKCCTMSHIPLPSGYFSALGVDNGVLRSVFVLPVQIRRQSVTVNMRVALKRHQEPESNRVVYIWDSVSTLESPQKLYDGVQFFDNGWTVVEALPTEDPTNPMTIVQFFWRIIPDTQSFSRHGQVGLLSDVLIATYTTMFQSLKDVLENILVDAMIAKRQA